MKYNFCTLFNKNYLYRGLTLYNSLLKICPDFHLWILCMDEKTFKILTALNLKKTTLITLKQFEDPELLKIKSTRTNVEYCWTCTPSLPLYILKKTSKLANISYLDADLLFYSNPQPIYQKFSENSILITPHRYSPEYAHQKKRCGIYNVSMVIFRNDSEGLSCLNIWRKQCLDWCFFRYEKGKLGDQLYLNNWPKKFQKVKILQHKGGGLAPWNINSYEIKKNKNKIYVDNDNLIFYHFHGLKIFSHKKFYLTGYKIPKEKKQIIYQPYVLALQQAVKQVENLFPDFQGFDHNSIKAKLQRKINSAKIFIKKIV